MVFGAEFCFGKFIFRLFHFYAAVFTLHLRAMPMPCSCAGHSAYNDEFIARIGLRLCSLLERLLCCPDGQTSKCFYLQNIKI